MALRLLEILAPASRRGEIQIFLEGKKVQTFWEEEVSGDRVLFHVLAPTDMSGELMDDVEETFAGYGDIHMVLLAVEAALPKAEEEEPAEKRTPSTATLETGAEEKKRAAPRIGREELYNDLSGGAEITNGYLVAVALSAVVAAVGLIKDDVAVIIGAMVIAPLLGPNMALALATTLGDTKLGSRALRANLVGVVLTLLLSVVLGLLVPVDPAAGEILSRTSLGLEDLALALAAGGAGALAVASGTQVSLVGVMVAVALMPPLVNAGLLFGAGQMRMAMGAALLVLANVVCVNLSAVVAFVSVGVRPRTWWEADRARQATRLALLVWIGLLLILVVQIILALYRNGDLP